MKNKKILGLVIGLLSMVLALVFYDWILCVILFLALWGNNASQ